MAFTDTVKIANSEERIKEQGRADRNFDAAVELKFNAIFFQVSPKGMHCTNPKLFPVQVFYRNLLKRSRF